MAAQVVRVKRETLKACMTCPLCNKLLREATTISLCLHTFCRRCIYNKLSDEGDDCCPVCDIELGCLPVDKLRPDHNLQDIRAKIFPSKRIKIEAPQVLPSVSPPAKRKERSLSSLVVNTPKVPVQSGFTGKRSKANTRIQGIFNSPEIPHKKDDLTEGHPSSTSSPESLGNVSHDKKQPRSEEILKNNKNNVLESKTDLWTPLNCLVEAANRTKLSKLNPQKGFCPKTSPNAPNRQQNLTEDIDGADSIHASNSEACELKPKSRVHAQNTKDQGDKLRMLLVQRRVKRKRLREGTRIKVSFSDTQGATKQAMVDALGNLDRRNSPIWFSLVASEDHVQEILNIPAKLTDFYSSLASDVTKNCFRNGEASLPQIPSCYLRVKDGKMPVSFIQKYLVKKLNLSSETEVEILCRGQAVLPTLHLYNLVDLWFRTASTSKKVPASVGGSAKEFVMVLSYCRKVEAP